MILSDKCKIKSVYHQRTSTIRTYNEYCSRRQMIPEERPEIQE